MPEKVLAVSIVHLFGEHKERYFQGFKPSTDIDFLPLIDKHSLFLLRRETSPEQTIDAEHDPQYKQIIPYTVFKYGNKYFVYQRIAGKGKEKGEDRLFDKHSIGLGGHINPEDGNGTRPLLEETLRREFEEEEADYPYPYTAKIIGYINDDNDEVGQVHFGVVYLVDGENPNIQVRETDKLVGRDLMTIAEIVMYGERIDSTNPFENWSKIVIDYLKTGLN